MRRGFSGGHVQSGSQRRGTPVSTRPEVLGVRDLLGSSIRLHACSAVKLCVIRNLQTFGITSRYENGAQWHYNTLVRLLQFGYKFKLDRKYIIAISKEIAYNWFRDTITKCVEQHDFISLYNSNFSITLSRFPCLIYINSV